jgi:hypothetical protein
VIVSILLMLSLVLMVTTVFTHIDVRALALVLGVILLVGYVAAGAVILTMRRRRGPAPAPTIPVGRRETWRMPRLSLLDRPKWSRGRMAGMYALRVYLVVAVVLLFVKAVELGVHK